MDLIYTDANWEDAGILESVSMDMECGDTNTFELTVPLDVYSEIGGKSLIYFENTEYGGIIDSQTLETESETITYTGTTWRGLLAKKIICPDSGEDYYTVSGDANAILATLIERLSLGDLFEASSDTSGITVAGYSFDRYTDAYSGIIKMLTKNGAKLMLAKKSDKVTLSAAASVDYSGQSEYSSDQYQFTVDKYMRQINHLICLGQGELSERTVVHLYADADGNISETQTFFGIDEIASVYENTSCSTADELKADGIARFEESLSDGSVDMGFDSDETIYDIGDIVGVVDDAKNISVTASIVSKTVTVDNGSVSIDCKIGEATTTPTDITKNTVVVEVNSTPAAASAAQAETYATEAGESEENAAASAESATTSAESAATSAESAKAYAESAEASAESVNEYVTDLETAVSSAATSATEAETAEDNAKNYAIEAESYAHGGTSSRDGEDTDNAKYYSEQAKTSANAAEASASNASIYEASVKTYATNAAASENNAKAYATEAATSEANAKTYASNAATSESNAATSASNAAASESNAASSATSAETSASAAATSADNVMSYELEAASNAEAAETSAANAAASATAAAASATGSTDSAKYYYEQTKGILEAAGGFVTIVGSTTYSELQDQSKVAGYGYIVTDAFAADDTFDDSDISGDFSAGTVVVWTLAEKWKCLSGAMQLATADINGLFSADDYTRMINMRRTTIKKLDASTLKSAISSGDLDLYGIKDGDYFTDGTYTYTLAHYNYYEGAFSCTTNHYTVLVSGIAIHRANETSTTAGGYNSSEIKTYLEETVLPELESNLEELGLSVLSHKIRVSSTVTNGVASASVSADAKISLPTQTQIYGYPAFCDGANYNIGHDFAQFDLFAKRSYVRHRTNFKFMNFWLRDVVSDSSFAYASGWATYLYASTAGGVVAVISIY